MLAGELQANSSLSSVMFDVGFTWKNDKSVLVSPDGKTEWNMTTKADVSADIDINKYEDKLANITQDNYHQVYNALRILEVTNLRIAKRIDKTVGDSLVQKVRDAKKIVYKLQNYTEIPSAFIKNSYNELLAKLNDIDNIAIKTYFS